MWKELLVHEVCVHSTQHYAGTKLLTAGFQHVFPSMEWTHTWHSPHFTPNSQVYRSTISSHRMKGSRVGGNALNPLPLNDLFHEDSSFPTGTLVNHSISPALSHIPSQVCVSPLQLPVKSEALWCEWSGNVHQPGLLWSMANRAQGLGSLEIQAPRPAWVTPNAGSGVRLPGPESQHILTNCITLGKSPSLSEPQTPHCGANRSTYPVRLWKVREREKMRERDEAVFPILPDKTPGKGGDFWVPLQAHWHPKGLTAL